MRKLGGEARGEKAEGGAGSPRLSPQELCLLRALGLTWVLKVFLGLAQLTHLDHKHDAWDQTTDRRQGTLWTMGLS